jgi:hypothetical protein
VSTTELSAKVRKPAAGTWRDSAWGLVVGGLDVMLRRCYGIHEFTDDPDCVIRISLGVACFPVALSDGTEVHVGDRIGVLHLWNEHLPRFPSRGPDLCWASDMRRRVRRSLERLTDHMEAHPDWRDVRALRAEAAFVSRIGAFQLSRVAERHGFEMIAAPASVARQLHDLGENFLLWGMARAFNPAALRRCRFIRDRHELWISRRRLVARYARQRPSSGFRKAPPIGDRECWR